MRLLRVIRPIVRWLTRGLTALCLLLAVGTVVLWVRSHRTQDAVVWGGWFFKDVADLMDLAEERGLVRTGKGEFLFWRRAQKITGIPAEPARDLRRRDPFRNPRWLTSDIGPGNTYGPDVADTAWRKLGFFYGVKPGRVPTTVYTEAGAPLWAFAAAFALPPAVHGTLRLRRRRRGRGRRGSASAFACAACGYDCRATPARCPECGRDRPSPGDTVPGRPPP